MLALMEMTNPIWEWLIAPIALVSLGFAVGHFVGRWEKNEEALWRKNQISAPKPFIPDYPHLQPLGERHQQPYDWEKKDRRAERERRELDDEVWRFWWAAKAKDRDAAREVTKNLRSGNHE